MCVLFFFALPGICKNAPAASSLSAPHPKGWGFFAQIFQNFNVIISFAAYTARINRKGVTPYEIPSRVEARDHRL